MTKEKEKNKNYKCVECKKKYYEFHIHFCEYNIQEYFGCIKCDNTCIKCQNSKFK
mgnify:CR=1 FL=1